MNKLFYLFGNELRKSKNDYILVAVIQTFIWVSSYIVSIVKCNKIIEKAQNFGANTSSGVYATSVIDMGYLGITILAASVIYAFYIWAREFNSSNKSIYTIMMIPEKRESVYFVKFLNAITMFYMNLLLFIVITVLMVTIAPFVIKNGVFVNPFKILLNSNLAAEIYMPMTLRNFVVTDILIVAANTSLISFSFLINKLCSYKGGFAKFISVVISIASFVFMLFMSFVIVYEVEVIFMAIISIIVGYLGSKYILKRLEF